MSLSYISQATGVFLSEFFKFCPRLSVELDPHMGVVNWLWFSAWLSYHPPVLYIGFQECLLQRSGHILVVSCLVLSLCVKI